MSSTPHRTRSALGGLRPSRESPDHPRRRGLQGSAVRREARGRHRDPPTRQATDQPGDRPHRRLHARNPRPQDGATSTHGRPGGRGCPLEARWRPRLPLLPPRTPFNPLEERQGRRGADAEIRGPPRGRGHSRPPRR